MKKLCLLAAVVLMAFGVSYVTANKANEGDGFNITITPKVLVISSENTVVSVHSNIPYSIVNTVTLELDGIPAKFTKADACGDLVVKFNSDDVKDIVVPGNVTLTLTGELDDGTPFEAADTIIVKE